LKKSNLGYLYIALASFLFALISIIGKSAFNSGLKVYDLLIMQNAVSTLIMFLYLMMKDKKSIILTKDQLKNVLIQGLIGTSGSTIFFYLALEKTSAGIATMLIFIHPVFVTLFFVITGLRKITTINKLVLVLVVIGSGMVLNVFELNIVELPVVGIAYGIICSIAYAFFNIFADLKLKDIKPEVLPLYTSAILFVVSSILNPTFFRFDFDLNPQIMFYIVELAIVSGILPTIFVYKGIMLIGSEKVTLIATSELPITLILAFFILKETMVFTQIIGVIIIIGSLLMLQNESTVLNLFKNEREIKL